MSSYGPPGGPEYGNPADPWSAPPADPWGGDPSSVPPDQPPTSPPYGSPSYPGGYEQPGYAQPGYPAPQPGYGQPGYGQQPGYAPGYAQPPAQPGYAQPGQTGYTQPTYAQPGYGQPDYGWTQPAPPEPGNRRQTLLIVVVVVLALLLGIGGFAAFALTGKDDNKRPQTQNSGQPTSGPSTVSTTASSPDFRAVTQGQCIVNDGTDDAPKIRVVTCGAGTFEVIKRLDQTADFKKCQDVPGYTDHYYYDSPLDSLDFVLCLKRR